MTNDDLHNATQKTKETCFNRLCRCCWCL